MFPGDVLAVSPEMYRSPLDETSTGLMLFTILELLKTDELGLPDPQNIDVGLSLFPKA